jgi:hypothetical protein
MRLAEQTAYASRRGEKGQRAGRAYSAFLNTCVVPHRRVSIFWCAADE